MNSAMESDTMDCPVCAEPMVVLELEDIEIDYCIACGGIWLDAGELELLFGDPTACTAFLSAGNNAPPSKEKSRKCPICRKKMDKAVTPGDHPVTYDRCRHGDGLWLDQGELQAILTHAPASDAQQAVHTLLSDMFSGAGKKAAD